MKREFLQLAQSYNAKKHGVAGWFVSEKLDGMRAFWDGGISRGVLAAHIPWANTEKDARLKEAPVATGLWSRYGKVIHAPEGWLDRLPAIFLDGELYAGRQQFQKLISTVKDHKAGAGWHDVQFRVLDSPPVNNIFADGIINNTNFKKEIDFLAIQQWLINERHPFQSTGPAWDFQQRNNWLQRRVGINDTVVVHGQERLPFSTKEAQERLEAKLEEVLSLGGEGLVIKAPNNLWVPERSWGVLKFKPWHDAEGTVIGYTWGRETDKGSKLLGKMGALILKSDNGREFMLSGFTDAEREMTLKDDDPGAAQEPELLPGMKATDFWENYNFPRGSRVTYRYRELTDDGVPKEARYWRKYDS